MKSTLRIVICGQSVFLMAIENALANRPELEVIRLRSYQPDTIEKILALKPHLVLVEQYNGDNELMLALLRQGLALVELNEKGQGTFLSRHDVPVSDPTDLIRLIEQAETKL